MTSAIEVRVPDIGDFEDVDVIEVLVAPGDRVGVEDSLITLESDKASMEIPSPFAGVVVEVRVGLGDKVSEGSVLLLLEVDASLADETRGAAEAATRPAARPEPLPESTPRRPGDARPSPPPVAGPTAPSPPSGSIPHASPLVRRVARELGVDLSRPTPRGPAGRILEQDVKAYVRERLVGETAGRAVIPGSLPGAPIDAAPPSHLDSQSGEVEVRELTRTQRAAGRNLSRSWQTIPHVTQHDEADITELEAFRNAQAERAEGREVKLTLLPFLLKAVASALCAFPEFGASLDPSGEKILIRHTHHIGVAVDTDRGLVVPVVRDVGRKRLLELAAEVADLAARARANKVSPRELQGGCFSISSLGGIGGTGFTPIVNAPEVAVLGVSRTVTKAIWTQGSQGEEGRFAPRRMLPLSLSYDHRVIEGVAGARFTSHLARSLSHIEHLLL